ncbi:endonuclease/exonuclease/phosphatase family protein [Winogradskya humida]|uniref:Teicoplanin resistance protein VanJ n=1 Tax=Winogradskya humida TaxID=113566 RepID=A0ABQ3ZI50_9ACTN|nr:endonuclease/exonuclease/phosphatase family protein [Actinoplanes humidus]GIE18143.1 teicoplanin resistance protein VanJ [Actinoplanes humidus]
MLAVGVAGVLWLHRLVPGWLGTAIDSGLPWVGVAVPVLIAVSAVRRSVRTLAVCLVPCVVWVVMFGPVLLPRSGADHHDLRVATLNLGAGNVEPEETLLAVTATDPDVLVLQELTGVNELAATKALKHVWPHYTVSGTVGVWSKVPLSDAAPVDIGIGWTRALRVTVPTADGPVRIYAAHLASARPAATSARDRTLVALAKVVAADDSPRLLLAGDLNTTTTDREFRELAPLKDTQEEAGSGFGFTWPSRIPLIRPDHILQRGMATERSWVVRAPGSDHRAAIAELDTA